MELCEQFKETLQEQDDNRRQTLMFSVCRKLSRILPFPSVISVLQQKPNILKYLLIASQLYENSVLLLFYALQDRYQEQQDYIKLYFDCVIKCLINQEIYCQTVNDNDTKLRWFLLENSKIFINKIQLTFFDNEIISQKVNNFFKSFIKYNSNFDMLNSCFQFALDKRNVWILLRELDQQFEIDVEDQLVALSQVMSSKNLDYISEKIEQKREEASNYGLTKKELKQQMLEEWLFQPSEVPLLVANHATVDQLSSEVFKSNMLLDLFLSFLLFPTRNPQVVPNKLYNFYVDLNPPDPPSFRQLNVNVSQERRPIIQFRAFRTMQVITDNRNNFLLTRVNKEYYQRAYSMLYECLKQDLVAITICPEIIIQYLSFLLYQEPEMSTFFLIFYNIPYRLMLFLDIPEISQFFTQLMNFLQTPYSKVHNESNLLIWQYFDFSNFFSDLLNMTIFNSKTIDDVITLKSNELYRPKNLEEILRRPDFTPLQVEKQFPQPEQKKVAEEIDELDQDLDHIFQYLPNKCQKTVKIFEKMLDQASKKKESKVKQRMSLAASPPQFLQTKNLKTEDQTPITFSPTRRRTILAPKLASMFDGSLKRSLVVNPIEFDNMPQTTTNSTTRSQLQALTNPSNLFGVLTEQIQLINKKNTSEIVQKPMFQRMLVKKPTQMIMLHSRQLSNQQRLSQQSSLINITESLNKSRIQNSIILNKFTHLVGSIKSYDIDKEFCIYPPDLKDQQIDDFEKLAFDEEFQKLSFKNENYTKGALQCIYDILHIIFTQKKFILQNNHHFENPEFYLNILIGENKSFFIDIIAKNYLLKQKSEEEFLCTFIIAGRIYNLILSQYNLKMFLFNFQEHIMLICKILLTQLLTSKLSIRTITLLESFTLILENTKSQLLSHIPISFWHLLIETYSIHNSNQIFINYFRRIFVTTFIYGNLVIYNKILLKINFLSYFKDNPEQIKMIFLILYMMFKLRQDGLKQLKRQITLLSSWNALSNWFKKDLQCLEQLKFQEYTKGLRSEDIARIQIMIENKDSKKNKFCKP
ncbi:unnamed protein product [Paramecium pentaurelia]|uniref:Uncharacterized protein n=1 Tax=Paramecium pentaurelia TaxID=43138 RepID=A0A8S1UQA3_9CILI|nr:unnamed protein product [Paramecium pentaurelia]